MQRALALEALAGPALEVLAEEVADLAGVFMPAPQSLEGNQLRLP